MTDYTSGETMTTKEHMTELASELAYFLKTASDAELVEWRENLLNTAECIEQIGKEYKADRQLTLTFYDGLDVWDVRPKGE